MAEKRGWFGRLKQFVRDYPWLTLAIVFVVAGGVTLGASTFGAGLIVPVAIVLVPWIAAAFSLNVLITIADQKRLRKKTIDNQKRENDRSKIDKYLILKVDDRIFHFGKPINQEHFNFRARFVKLLKAMEAMVPPPPHTDPKVQALIQAINRLHASMWALESGFLSSQDNKDYIISFNTVCDTLEHQYVSSQRYQRSMPLPEYSVSDYLGRQDAPMVWEPMSQTWFIQLLIQIGYQENYRGMCYGVAQMAMQAILSDNLKGFNERFNILRLYKDIPADSPGSLKNALAAVHEKVKARQTLTRDDCNLLDVDAFLQGVSLYQKPDGAFFVAKDDKADKWLSTGYIIPPLLPDKLLQHNGTIKQLIKFNRKRNQSSYASMLTELESIFKKSDMIISIQLSAHLHAINLSYHPEQGWIFLDANYLPMKVLGRGAADQAAQHIFRAFDFQGNLGAHGKLSIGSMMYVHANDHNREQVDMFTDEMKRWCKQHRPGKKYEMSQPYQDYLAQQAALKRRLEAAKAVEAAKAKALAEQAAREKVAAKTLAARQAAARQMAAQTRKPSPRKPPTTPHPPRPPSQKPPTTPHPPRPPSQKPPWVVPPSSRGRWSAPHTATQRTATSGLASTAEQRKQAPPSPPSVPLPDTLLAQHGLVSNFPPFTSQYTQSTYEAMLNQLESIFQVGHITVSMRLSAENHAVNVSYHPEKGWIFADANALPIKVVGLGSEGAREMARLVFEAYKKMSPLKESFEIISMMYVHVNDGNRQQMEQFKREMVGWNLHCLSHNDLSCQYKMSSEYQEYFKRVEGSAPQFREPR
jgi:hypothetical protein